MPFEAARNRRPKLAVGSLFGDEAADSKKDKRVPRDRQPEASFSAMPSGLAGTGHN
jgi:hypothetical protein